MNDAPLGVFDSGIGGLTVARALFERLPHEAVLYFGDTARVPYGPKSPETVRRYSAEILAYLNPGAWLDGYRYAVVTGDAIELKSFSA